MAKTDGFTDIMEAMARDCRYIGAKTTRKFYGIILKCSRTKQGLRWYAEGMPVKVATVIKMTATEALVGRTNEVSNEGEQE